MLDHNLSTRVRVELEALIDLPLASPAHLPPHLEELGRERGVPLHAMLIQLVAQLDLAEEEARRHWHSVVSHRADLAERMGRDPGLRVAALDYFLNGEPHFFRPTVVDRPLLERVAGSATIDGLTGLANLRHFLVSLRREIHRARRHFLEFSLALLDLDDFKRINDLRGRRGGDAVLRRVADLVLSRMREMDLAARYGGERFILLLPGTRRVGAFVVADRIRVSVAELFLHSSSEADRIPVTLSAGIAAFPADGETEEALLEKVERSLSTAKARGKNTVIIHPEERRRSLRFRPAARGIQVGAVSLEDASPRLLRIADLSAGGALLLSERGYREGQDLELRFLRPLSPGYDLPLHARVVRQEERRQAESEGRFAVSVQFLAGRTDEALALDALLEGLRREGVEQGSS